MEKNENKHDKSPAHSSVSNILRVLSKPRTHIPANKEVEALGERPGEWGHEDEDEGCDVAGAGGHTQRTATEEGLRSEEGKALIKKLSF